MMVVSQHRAVAVIEPKITERFRSRKHTGTGGVSFTLHPGPNRGFLPRRATWKIIRPLSPSQAVVPIECESPVKKCRALNKNGIRIPRLDFTSADRLTNAVNYRLEYYPAEDYVRNAVPTRTTQDLSSGRQLTNSNKTFLNPRETEKETLFRSNTEIRSSGCTLQRSKPVSLNFPTVNRPCFLPTLTTSSSANTTNSNNKQNEVSNDGLITQNESNKDVVAEPINNHNATVMGVDTTTTRGGTLSQPCLSIASSVGATQIFPHLFLGSQKDVVDENMMRANGITYVLNISKTCTKPEFIDRGHFHRISVHDSYQEKMTPHIKDAIEFIEKVRKQNQKVIVHCLAGVSRSATVAIAYVLHYLRISFEEAYRFVKEKRPSISPNFNFLGQLMEFEHSLRQSGHLTCKRTGSLSEDDSENDSELKLELRNKSVGNVLDTKPDCSPLIMPATCTFTCTTQTSKPCQASGTTLRISTPVSSSSFCRRRNGPCFSKGAFSSSTAATNANNSSNNGKRGSTASKPKILVDVHVKVPPTPRVADASRRLGSDGFEKYEAMECFNSGSSYMVADAFSSPAEAMDCGENTSAAFAKPKTAPNTPMISRNKSAETSASWHYGRYIPLKHRRCASSGGIATDVLQSPLNMKRRFEARAERSSSIGELNLGEQFMDVDRYNEKRGASFSGSYYDHSEPSGRAPHKFIAINSRSPKIQRKSFQLNLRPMYSSSGAQSWSTRNYEDPAANVLGMETPVPVFDCTHSMSDASQDTSLRLVPRVDVDDFSVIDSMLPLTLSSPGLDKENGESSPPFLMADSGKVSPTPATCPVIATDLSGPSFDSPRFAYKSSFTVTSCSKTHQITDAQTSQPFVLSASCDLKLKWRSGKDRRRQSLDSGFLSPRTSQTFASPTSQQIVFSSAKSRTSSPVNGTCHENSDSEPDNRNSNVRRRNAVELIGCS